MKKFFKRLGKGCGYVVLYLLVAIGTAAGLIFLMPAGNTNVSANQIPVQLKQMWENLQGSNAIDINLDVNIDTQSDNIQVAANVKLDLSEGFDNLKLSGNVDLSLKDSKMNLNLFYGDGEIFVETLNGKFEMKTSSIGESFGKITNILGLSIPSLGGIDLSSIDSDMILGFLSDFQEIKGKDGTKLEINISMIDPPIKLYVYCDNDYNLQRIELPQTSISGTTFSVNADVQCPEKVETTKPSGDDFIDVSDLVDVAGVALKTLGQDTLGFDLKVQTKDFALEGTLSADIKNLNAMFETTLLDMPLKVAIFKDSFCYLEYGNMYLKFALADTAKLTEFLAKHFDVHLPIEQVAALLSAIQSGNLMQVLPALSFGAKTPNLDEIDLSILEKLDRDGEKFSISLRDIGKINVTSEAETLKAVSFESDFLSIFADIKTPKEVQISDVEHADFGKLLPAIDALFDTIKQDKLAGKAHLTYGEISADADFKVMLQNKSMQVAAQAKAYGQTISLNYQNEKLFVDFSGLKIVGEKEDIDYILNLFDLKIASSNSVGGIIEVLKKLVDTQNSRSLISIQSKDNVVEIGILDKATILLNYDELLKSIKIVAGEFEATIDLTAQTSFSEISEENYVSARDIANKVHKVMEYVKGRKFYLTFDGEYQDISLSGKFNFDEDGLQAEVDAFAYGQNAKLRILDETIFVDVKDLHFKAALKDGEKIAGLLSKEVGIDVEELLEKFKSAENKIDLEKVLAHLWLEYQENNLIVKYENLVSDVVFENNMLSYADVTYAELSAHVALSSKNTITPVGDVEYSDVTDILNKAGKVYEYMKGGEYYATLNAAYGDLLNLTGYVGYDEDGLQAEIDAVAYGQNAKIRVLGSQIYVDFKDLHLTADLSNLKEIVEILSTRFGLDIKLPEKMPNLKDLNFKETLGNLNLEEILSNLTIGYADDTLTFGYSGIAASVVFENDMLSYADIAYDKLSAHISLGEKQEVTALGQEAYTDIEEILNKAVWVYEYVKGGRYYATLDATYGDLLNLTGYVGYDEDGLQAEIDIVAYKQTAKIRVFGTKIYVDFKDLHLTADLENWKEILSVVSKEFDIDFDSLLGKFNLDVNKLEELLEGKQNFSQVLENQSLDISEILNDIEIGYADQILTIKYKGVSAKVSFAEDAISNVTVLYGDMGAIITLSAKENIEDIGKNVVYSDAIEVLEKVGETYRYVQNGKFYFEVAGSYEDVLTFSGFVDYDNDKGLRAELEITAYGQTGKIRIVGTKVYVDVKDLHTSADIKEWKKIVDLIDEAFGLELGATMEKLGQQDDLQKTLEEVLEKIGLSYENDILKVSYAGANISINFEGNNLSNAKVEFEGVSATITKVSYPSKFTEIENPEIYVPVENVISKAGFVYDYVTNKQFYLSVEATIDGKFKILGTINFDRQNGLSANVSTIVNGVSISAKILDGTIYLSIANLRLKFELDEIPNVLNFLKEQFGVDFVDEYEQYKWIIDDLIVKKDINFSDFSNLGIGKEFDVAGILEKLGLSMTANNLKVTLSEPVLTADIAFDQEKLTSIQVQTEKFNLFVKLKGKEEISLGDMEYFNLVDILPVVRSIKNYVYGKQYNLLANAEVFEGETKIYDAKNIVLQVDATKNLQFYADAHVLGVGGTKSAGFDLKLNASMYDEYLYFDYNGLCLKLRNDGVQNILSIVCEMFGIDPSILSIITGKVSESSGIDTSFVTKLLPGVDTSNPIGLLNMIKDFSMNASVFDITLDGSLLSGSEGAENMHVQIYMNEFGELEKLVIKNLYTGVTANEHFNLEINFAALDHMTSPDMSKKYIDLTGAEDLIEAIINTASHKTFELTGNLKVNMNIIGINIDWDIPLVLQAKFVDGNPEIFAQIGVIPVPLGGAINNDTPWTLPTIKNRMLYIYYKDGYVYFYRHETRNRGDSYEKKLKAHIETVMDDILYYVQWGTGFTDDIINAIRKSLAIEHDINLGNIIKEFTLPQADNPYYNISLNMEELTGDDKMGTMSLGIGISNFSGNDEQNNPYTHKVVGQLTFAMDMPLISGTTLYLKSNNPDGSKNLFLGLDKDLDFGDFDSFVGNYQYPENVEYDAVNGNWTQSAERKFTVTFETNRPELTENPVTGLKGTEFTLPNYTQTYEDVVQDENGEIKEKTKVHFAGWFTDPNFSTGSKFVKGIIPRHNVTIYAKWEMEREETFRTVYYHDSDGTLKATQFDLVGAELRQDIENMDIKRKKNESDGFQFAVEFDGWVDVDDAPFTHIPDYSINLYAHYKADESLIKRTLSFMTGAGPTLHDIKFYGNTKDIRGQSNPFDRYGNEQYGENIYYASEDYTYKFEGWFFDEGFSRPFDYAMPTHDLTIYAKWTEIMEWKFQIYDNGVGLLHDDNGGDLYLKKGTKIIPYSADIVAGENEFVLPESVKVVTQGDEKTLWYVDAGYENQTDLPNVMANGDLELHLRNKFDVTYTYHVNENGAWTIQTYSAKHYQGEKITLMAQEDYYIDYQEDGHNSYRDNYHFNGYDVNGTTYGSCAQYVVQNKSVSFEAKYSISKQNYYLIEFVLEAYTVLGYTKGAFKTAPPAISSEWVLDGTTINLTQSKYQVTCEMYTQLIGKASNTFRSTTWGEKAWGNLTSGGSGFTSYTVSGHNQKLYACWKKV